MEHDWQFFAVQGERSTRAVVICRRCGDSRYSLIDPGGGRRLALGGECPVDRIEPDGSPRTPPVLGVS